MEFQKVYDRLDVTLEECGEPFYNDKIPAVLDEFEKSGILTIDNGAKCIWVDGHTNHPLIVQESDGGSGYDSTDMAALKYRLQELKATHIIAVTDVGQAGHFELCYGAAGMIG
jgi:arginyl-tRNA synthetase